MRDGQSEFWQTAIRQLRLAASCLAIALVAAPAPVSASDQSVIAFDDVAPGTGDFSVFVPFQVDLFGGTVILAQPGTPAVSGSQVYRGSAMGFRLADPYSFSWPAVGAFVTGSAAITLAVWAYDYGLDMEVVAGSSAVGAGSLNAYLGIGSPVAPGYFTRAVFESPDPFSLDDLTLGLDGIAPGIPELASWAMMIAGLALTGAGLRRRRTASPAGGSEDIDNREGVRSC